ncbi:MAG: hypothetical protein UT86_C0003G0014 [Candidatus Magasanikbacteria bacterium GW2011_GWC2_40_17]|uniref:Uncharacterized protein n=1 Tax=Candidatus Magasanikbacteria bacterium GW2011_GWA2_42_32 TaxID=1619039 RepID=A0A0G1A790_9BACT|nr:MAG: hypothetical protein UT86_C0003G0014 [Candidatus Magasanikbacteria bacterium GW2011_GWC2_40_17]KKS56917.1 MAG: hypothetical protein UV20_C0004G0013 [Candidatus Magasanikbacteria bacterium GW2011_GWA2_42_32]OGH85513.1 MAG: hypothetical protein A2294_03210 [Candidatus Magasanikbacteria bacterium RIFOXYB2_FULL_38_10]
MDESQPIIRDFTPSPIEEPPLKNRRSCLWRAFTLILTLGILAILIFSFISIFYSGPTIKRMAVLPDLFPTDIPLYRFDDRNSIQYQDAKENDTFFNRLSQIPKYIFGPLILKFNPNFSPEQKILHNNIALSNTLKWSEIKIILQPASDSSLDIAEIEWENINEVPRKIKDFYKKNLVSQDYQVKEENKNGGNFYLSFTKEKTSGELFITDDQDKNKTQRITLKVNFSNQK